MNLIIKPTNRCNMNCSYCFQQHSKDTLTQDQIMHFIDLALSTSPQLHIIWHGGEPTLLPTEFYEYIMDYFSSADITWSLQSNGTLIDDKWLDLIERYHIHTSVSFDFEETGLRPFSEHIAELLHSDYIQPITVLHRWNIGRAIELYEKFKSTYKDKKLCFNLAYDTKTSKQSILPSQFALYTEFLCYILGDTSPDALEERNLSEYIKVFGDGTSNLCVRNCKHSWLTLDSTGLIYPCDRYSESSYSLEHINTIQSLTDALVSQAYRKHLDSINQININCATCEYSQYCYDRCPLNHQNPNYCDLIKLVITTLINFIIANGIQNIQYSSTIKD